MIEIACCKACGRPYRVPRVSGIIAPVILRLLERRPAGVSLYALGQEVYCGTRDAPEHWQRSLRTTICRMNKELAVHGWRITAAGRGESAYRLVGIDPAAPPTPKFEPRRRWTRKDTAIIRVSPLSNRELAAALHRSTEAVKVRRSLLRNGRIT